MILFIKSTTICCGFCYYLVNRANKDNVGYMLDYNSDIEKKIHDIGDEIYQMKDKYQILYHYNNQWILKAKAFREYGDIRIPTEAYIDRNMINELSCRLEKYDCCIDIPSSIMLDDGKFKVIGIKIK